MLQDLREYLQENPDNAVAPDWSETVRNSVRTQDVLLLQDFAEQCCLEMWLSEPLFSKKKCCLYYILDLKWILLKDLLCFHADQK